MKPTLKRALKLSETRKYHPQGNYRFYHYTALNHLSQTMSSFQLIESVECTVINLLLLLVSKERLSAALKSSHKSHTYS